MGMQVQSLEQAQAIGQSNRSSTPCTDELVTHLVNNKGYSEREARNALFIRTEPEHYGSNPHEVALALIKGQLLHFIPRIGFMKGLLAEREASYEKLAPEFAAQATA